MRSDATTRCPARVSNPGPLLLGSEALSTGLPGVRACVCISLAVGSRSFMTCAKELLGLLL